MSPERLLLVEDDATTREVLTLLLEADGWDVRGVDSGEAALDVLGGGGVHPGVILCDLHLPGVQGALLAEALRPLAPEAFLLGMSASKAGEESAAYTGVLRKPFGPAELRALLETLQAGPSAGSDGPNSYGQAAGPGLPVISTETFLKLEQQMGKRARDLYAFALADAGDRLRRMEESLRDDNAAAFHAEAHQLKGSAGMIGAQRLQALAAAAEASSEFGSRGENVREMHLACDELRLMLETLFPI